MKLHETFEQSAICTKDLKPFFINFNLSHLISFNLVPDKCDRSEDEPSLRHLLQPVGPPLRDGLHTGGDANLLQLQGERERRCNSFKTFETPTDIVTRMAMLSCLSQIYKDIKMRQERRRQSAVIQVTTNHQARFHTKFLNANA